MLPPIVLIVNGIFLVVILFLVWRMFRAADVYNKNQGDQVIQTKQRWKILWSIFYLLVLGLVATILNLLISSLTPAG